MYEYLSNCVEFINFVYYMNKNYVFAFVFTLVEILSAPPLVRSLVHTKFVYL